MNKQKMVKGFREIGNAFIDLHKSQGLTCENVDFYEESFKRKGCKNKVRRYLSFDDQDVYACDVSACHGTWANLLFNEEVDSGVCHLLGKRIINNRLGFVVDNIKYWAHQNPDIWGNTHGLWMFFSDGHLAFGKGEGKCSLLDIGKHYVAVSKRLDKANSKDIVWT